MPSEMLAPKKYLPRLKPWFMALLAIVIAAAPALPSHAEETIARLLELQGVVEVRRNGDTTWINAEENSALNSGDSVRTMGRSQAILLRPDGTTLELYPFSEATVEDEKAVMLLLGKIWSTFQKALDRPHSIRTPTSVALIRGTVLSVETEASGASRIAVVEGLVEVVDRQGEHREMVGAGFSVRADREGRLARLERAQAGMLDEGRGFMERVERGRQQRQRGAEPGRQSSGRDPKSDAGRSRGEMRPEHGAARERGERQDLKLRLEQRLERGAGARLEHMIDRTQREERRKHAEERREQAAERREERVKDRIDERLKRDP